MSRQHAAAAGIFLLLSIVMTWPLAPNLGRAVSDFGDPYLNIWILDWDWWATLHQPLSLFHANAVHPAKYSLAFSENLYGIAILLFPLRAIGVGPIAAYNIAMLLGFAFCGFSAYLLGRRLTGSFAAGLAAGVFYAFVPFRFVHVTHVQHVWGGWLPLLLLTLLWYADGGGAPEARTTRKRAVWFGVVFVMNGLTNIHYLFFGALAAGVTAAVLVPRRAWRDLVIALAGAMIVLAPFLYPYAAAAKLYGMERTYAESYLYSAQPSDWVTTNVQEPERRVFPGVLALTACVVAFVAWRQWQKLALAWLWIAIGFAGSLGMHFVFHEFLFGGVPGFRAIRVPARWAVIAYIGIAILIALATSKIRNRWIALIVPIAFLAELWTPPIRWYLAVPQAPPVYAWLAGGRTPIAEVPMDTFLSEYAYHLRATVHHRPMVNGVQQTQQRRDIAAKWFGNPIGDDFVDSLKEAGVDLIVVHADRLYQRAPVVREWLRRELDRGRISYVRDFSGVAEGDWVFSLRGAAGSPPAERLVTFLRGEIPCSPRTFVAPLTPGWDVKAKGELIVAGWAGSPHGLRHADIYFNNRTIRERIPLERIVRPRCGIAEYRFFHVFPRRPEGVWTETDIQIDVFDGAGNTISSEDRWFRWE